MKEVKSIPITKEQYNYLLPVYKDKNIYKGTASLQERHINKDIIEYSFIGTDEQFLDMQARCKYL